MPDEFYAPHAMPAAGTRFQHAGRCEMYLAPIVDLRLVIQVEPPKTARSIQLHVGKFSYSINEKMRTALTSPLDQAIAINRCAPSALRSSYES